MLRRETAEGLGQSRDLRARAEVARELLDVVSDFTAYEGPIGKPGGRRYDCARNGHSGKYSRNSRIFIDSQTVQGRAVEGVETKRIPTLTAVLESSSDGALLIDGKGPAILFLDDATLILLMLRGSRTDVGRTDERGAGEPGAGGGSMVGCTL